MSINILELGLQAVGVNELHQIDTLYESSNNNNNELKSNVIMQAVAPTVVAGMYNAARSETGLDFLQSDKITDNYIDLLFGSNAATVLQQMATYANVDELTVANQFNTFAAAAISTVRANALTTDKRNSIKNIVTAQKPFFAPYLPTQIQVGKMLGDAPLDDATNKMQGPVSSLLHKVENFLSGQESKENADKVKEEKM